MSASKDIVPRGKGLYLRSLRALPGPENTSRALREMGVTWVAVTAAVTSGEIVQSKDTYIRYTQALRKAGIECWSFLGLPAPETAEEGLRSTFTVAGWIQARGILLDPEREYRREPDAAQWLIKTSEKICDRGNLGLGFTSYGRPDMVGDFPWEVFAGHGFGSPQIYSPENIRPGLEAWKQYGWTYIAPSLNGWDATDMGDYLAQVPHFSAAIFWPPPGLPRPTYHQGIADWDGAGPRLWWKTLHTMARLQGSGQKEFFERVSARVGI